MKVKLDENVGELFVRAGHDVATVTSQGLCSASEDELITVCN